MKTITKLIAVILIVSVFACTKESIKTATVKSSSTDEQAAQSFSIGQKYGGGIIFYVDATKKHGLIAATADQSTQMHWYKGKYVVTKATGIAIGTGADNTAKIINKQGDNGSYAARVCTQYHGGGFTDWFLPSRGELNQLYKARNKVGGFEATNYWSSTESDANNASDQEFGGGFQFYDDKSFTIHVRAVRKF